MASLGDTVVNGRIQATGTIRGSQVFGTVFNDYAEYRLCEKLIEPGYIVTEDPDNCDYVKLCTTEKPSGTMFVISDTFGSCMGVTTQLSVPVALCGRVLVHIEEGQDLKVGDYLGCSKLGRGRKMTKKEARQYPERVVGRVSSIPKYDTWGSHNVKVNNRIWVNIK